MGNEAQEGKCWKISGGQGAWMDCGGSGGVPSGAILLILSGTCPAGFTEEITLNGRTLVGTLAANADVGTTGGADSVTPSGSVSQPTFTGAPGTTSSDSAGTPAGTVSQPTFTGSALGTHSHGVGTYANSTASFTPSGTNSTSTVVPLGTNSTSTVTPLGTIAWPAGVPTINEPNFTIVGTKMTTSGSGTAAATSFNGTTIASGSTTVNNPAQAITWPGGVPTFTGSSSTVAAQTFTGSSSTVGAQTFTGSSGTVPAETISGSSQAVSAGTPSGSVSQPSFTGAAMAGHSHTLTPAGTVSQPTFTGNAFDNRAAFVRVIFCKKD